MPGWFSTHGMLKSTPEPELKPNMRVNKKVNVKCAQCGKEFEKYSSMVNDHNFCDVKCMGKWNSEHKSGENNCLWKKIKTTCNWCGKDIEVIPWKIKNNKNVFCSQECHYKWKSKNIIGKKHPGWRGGKVKITCAWCGKEFERHSSSLKESKNKFCSQECHYKWESKKKVGENNPSWNGGKVKITCTYCGKEFEKIPSLIKKNNFCSNGCKGSWQSGENNPSWQDGSSFLPYCKSFNNNLKEKIRNRDNRTCQNCGVKENGSKHSVHHIHYDKENCYPDLITVCRSCNAKANSNRNEWEIFYMNKLNERQLLYWTQQNSN